MKRKPEAQASWGIGTTNKTVSCHVFRYIFLWGYRAEQYVAEYVGKLLLGERDSGGCKRQPRRKKNNRNE